SGVEADRPFANGRKGAAVACQKAQCIVRDARTRPKQDNRKGLVRNLIIAGTQLTSAGGYETQASVFDLEAPPVQPDEAVAVAVRDPGPLETETTEQHSVNLPVPAAGAASHSHRLCADPRPGAASRQMRLRRRCATRLGR